jgi:hypothetical protein
VIWERPLSPSHGGEPDSGTDTALNLVYVVDLAKGNLGDSAFAEFSSGAHIGFVAQNVYLFCAPENLSAIVRGNIDKPVLRKIMKLQSAQKIALAQSVGFQKDQ